MASSVITREKLDALECAIAEGALRVKYSDKEIEYRSLDDMFRARDWMRKCLGLVKKGSRIEFEHKRGTC